MECGYLKRTTRAPAVNADSALGARLKVALNSRWLSSNSFGVLVLASKFSDHEASARWKNFQYDFRERSLAGRVVAVAGGSGGLGSALVALLASEGAKIICGFRANRDRAESLQRAMRQQFAAEITLVAGDIVEKSVQQAYLD